MYRTVHILIWCAVGLCGYIVQVKSSVVDFAYYRMCVYLFQKLVVGSCWRRPVTCSSFGFCLMSRSGINGSTPAVSWLATGYNFQMRQQGFNSRLSQMLFDGTSVGTCITGVSGPTRAPMVWSSCSSLLKLNVLHAVTGIELTKESALKSIVSSGSNVFLVVPYVHALMTESDRTSICPGQIWQWMLLSLTISSMYAFVAVGFLCIRVCTICGQMDFRIVFFWSMCYIADFLRRGLLQSALVTRFLTKLLCQLV